MTTVCVKEDKSSTVHLEPDVLQQEAKIVNDVVIKYDLDKCVEWVKARGLERVSLTY